MNITNVWNHSNVWNNISVLIGLRTLCGIRLAFARKQISMREKQFNENYLRIFHKCMYWKKEWDNSTIQETLFIHLKLRLKLEIPYCTSVHVHISIGTGKGEKFILY